MAKQVRSPSRYGSDTPPSESISINFFVQQMNSSLFRPRSAFSLSTTSFRPAFDCFPNAFFAGEEPGGGERALFDLSSRGIAINPRRLKTLAKYVPSLKIF
jgi:hypothetical protein